MAFSECNGDSLSFFDRSSQRVYSFSGVYLSDPITIILEYVSCGDLLGYMRTSRGLHDEHYKTEKSPIIDLGCAELMSFAEQIASAMAHLERYNVSKSYIFHTSYLS